MQQNVVIPNITFINIVNLTPSLTRSSLPAPIFCPQKAARALDSVNTACVIIVSILPAAP
ncbi:hypothetical protein EVA_11476 [gut metagenome]|uniref:Uncharacterized protein n=1 Tax=gut metagenome TaxID=749906 RepID=J9GF43_9ZZZZ